MRTGTTHVILFPPEPEGMLAGAALRRQFGLDQDFQILGPSELARRVFGFAAEPGPRRIVVGDLAPSDSVQTLLVPALARLAEGGCRVRWIYGREEPASMLHTFADLIDLTYEEGAGGWRLVLPGREDTPFQKLAERIESEAPTDPWRIMLAALSTSWDWPRLYGASIRLAGLDAPGSDDLAWARGQVTEVERARRAVAAAPVRELDSALMAVVGDPTIRARVRLDVLRRVRTDVDAIAFAGGPGRLSVITTSEERDLSFLREAEGLLVELHRGLPLAGSISGVRAEFAWTPGKVPDAIVRLLGNGLPADGPASRRVGNAGRIHHPLDERIAKGLHGVPPADRSLLAEGLGASGTARPVPSGEEVAGVGAPIEVASLRNRLELVPSQDEAELEQEPPWR